MPTVQPEWEGAPAGGFSEGEVSPETQQDRVGPIAYRPDSEFHREARLRTTADLKEAYSGVNNNIAVVTALLGGFGISFATQDLNIGAHAVDTNVWADDDLGKEWWTFAIVLMAMLAIVTCFTAINNAQQIAQCPEPLFKKWFCSMETTLPTTFVLMGLCYALFIVAFALTCSLVLRAWMFYVAVVIFGLLFAAVGWFIMVKPTQFRLRLIKTAVANE